MRSLAIDSSLEGIAGIPLAMLTVPDTASSPLDIGPTEARTLYVVGSVAALSETSSPVANLGGVDNRTNVAFGAQVIRASDSGVGGLAHRAVTIAGAGTTQSMESGWPRGKPLAVCGWWDGSRFGCQGYRESPIIGAPTAVGSMSTAPRLRMAPISTGGTTPIAALAYRGVHDLDTRTLILNRLMQRYGNL